VEANSQNEIDVMAARKNASMIEIRANATRAKELADAQNRAQVRRITAEADAEAEYIRAKKLAEAKRVARLEEARAEKEAAILQADAQLYRSKLEADAELYRLKKTAEGNIEFLNDDVLELERIKAWGNQQSTTFLPSQAAMQFWSKAMLGGHHGGSDTPPTPIVVNDGDDYATRTTP
jgi:hypothetical protein